jgi:hypothetical protein
MRSKDPIIAGTLGLGAFALYLRTIAPSVAFIFDDTLEFQLVCYQLGIAHPTGYPLFTLLGKLFTFLPFGDVAFRVNLMSAFFAALTVAVLYLAACQLDAHPVAAALGAAIFAVGPTFWSQAVIAEVYTLNAFFVALLLYLLLRWNSQQSAISSQLMGIAFVYGLSLTHHRTMLLLAPAILLFIWLVSRESHIAYRISQILFFFLLPLLLYLYIPIRGLVTTSLDGAYQNTLDGFVRHVTASGYTAFIAENPLGQSRDAAFYLDLFLQQFTPLGAILGLLGAAALVRRPKMLALLGLAFLANVAFALGYRVADVEVYFLPSWLVLALCIGLGINVVMAAAGRLPAISGRVAPILVAATVAIVPLYLASINLPLVDLSRKWDVHDYGIDMLRQPLEPNAQVVGLLGEMTLLRYFQRTEGIRPDVITVAADREAERFAAITDGLAQGRAVYITRLLPGVEQRYSLSALGPLVRVRPPPSPSPVSGIGQGRGFGSGLRLMGFDLDPSRLQPIPNVWHSSNGRMLRVTLHWQAASKPSGDFKVSLKLRDASGHLVGQRDQVPVRDTYPTSAWRAGEFVDDVIDVPILAGAPPGDYRLDLTVYDPAAMRDLGHADLSSVSIPKEHELPYRLDLSQVVHASFGGQIELVAYDLPEATLRPGDAVPLTVLWQALKKTQDNFAAALWLENPAGSLGRCEIPLGAWEQGEPRRDWPSLLVPATADGAYRLKLQVLRDGRPLPIVRWFIPIGDTLDLGTIRVKGRERSFTIPQMQHTMGDMLGGKVRLLGYDLEPTNPRPGDVLRLTLYWQDIVPMDTSYTVFTHLLDPSGQLRGQRDSVPGAGTLPTTGWVPGEVITDRYDIAIDPAALPGDYVLELGLYNVATGQRLATSAGDAIRLRGIQVIAP